MVHCFTYLKAALAECVGRRKEVLVGKVIHAVREVWSWLDNASVEDMHNRFCKRCASAVEVPHYFSCGFQSDLSGDEMRMATATAIVARGSGVASGGAERLDDVFCLVKTFMVDAHLQLAPLLVLPIAKDQRVRATPNLVVQRHHLTEW